MRKRSPQGFWLPDHRNQATAWAVGVWHAPALHGGNGAAASYRAETEQATEMVSPSNVSMDDCLVGENVEGRDDMLRRQVVLATLSAVPSAAYGAGEGIIGYCLSVIQSLALLYGRLGG